MEDSKIKKNKELLDAFIDNRPIPRIYRVDYRFDKQFGCVYCIENKNNNKKYIGSVYSIWSGIKYPTIYTRLRKRASCYLYEYNYSLNHPCEKKYNRAIIQAMVDEGFDNFVMYPLAETTLDNHIPTELHFINKYNTIENGYNQNYSGAHLFKPGNKLTANDKKIRSTQIVAINLDEKKIMFSDSMKLFADFMKSSKDMIKNSNRKGRSYKGWFIFYIDPDKRSHVLNTNVLGEGLPKQDRHSESSKNDYVKLYNTISAFLIFNNNEYFPDFEILDPLQYIDK